MTTTITYTIPGVPRLNQLSEASNPRMDCVFTSNAALATAYLKKPYTGTQLKAMDTDDYGPHYTGGASEAKLLDTMARLGITVTRVPSATQFGLIHTIHLEVSRGHGVIVTMPSQWNSAVTNAGASWNPRTYTGPSHVGLACGVGGNAGSGMIRVMNPWGGFWQDQSDAWWQQRLLYGEVWVATLTPKPAVVSVPVAKPAPVSAPVATAGPSVASLQAQIATLTAQHTADLARITSLTQQLKDAEATARVPVPSVPAPTPEASHDLLERVEAVLQQLLAKL